MNFAASSKNPEKKANTLALVLACSLVGKQKNILKITLSDGSDYATLLGFNRAYLAKFIKSGDLIYINGQVKEEKGEKIISNFEIKKLKENCSRKELFETSMGETEILPVYSLSDGLKMKNVRAFVKEALRKYLPLIESEMSEEIIKRHDLLEKREAIQNIHFPSSLELLEKARRTLVFESFFLMRLKMMQKSWEERGSACEENEGFGEENFLKSLSPLQKKLLQALPFTLTDGQKKVIFEINCDIDRSFRERSKWMKGEKIQKTPFSAARIVEGDVGSGKTLVALFAILRAANMGFQSALCCPRELLALQHGETAANLFSPLGVKVAFLSGNTKAKGRKALLEKLKSGEIDVLIGTHAVFSDDVLYKDLFLVVMDEQHKFGISERKSLLEKGKKIINGVSFYTNCILMSATPIPQTLALSLFGDLDLSIIAQVPKGRKTIKTFLVREGNEKNAYERVRKELEAGHKSYFVYPAIGENERGLKNVEEYFKKLQREIYPEYECRLIHSKCDEAALKSVWEFRDGKVQILVATTTIEVGIDVANATCIVIEDADYFGLSTLHQLRGRVGRGEKQSYCFLIYSKNISEEGIERMKILRENTDGFRIAEEDLRLRGPGELEGEAQSGEIDIPLVRIEKDSPLLLEAHECAKRYFKREILKSSHS